MSRFGRCVALALLAWPGMVSESPASQLETCPHVCHLQATAEGSSQVTLHISAIFLNDEDHLQLIVTIFPLPPISFAAGTC